jgi:hypothetical protein
VWAIFGRIAAEVDCEDSKMQSAAEYLEKARSAPSLLFEGVDTYLAMLRDHDTTFVSSYMSAGDFQEQHDALYKANQSKIQTALEAQKKYLGEGFAQATLCGAILQRAAKAIECYRAIQ